MAKIIRYEVGDDYDVGQLDRNDFPIWGIDAIYDKAEGGFDNRHRNAIMVMTSDEDRRRCLEALNAQLGLDVVGRPRRSEQKLATDNSVQCEALGLVLHPAPGTHLCGPCRFTSCPAHPIRRGPVRRAAE
ncbi:MAG TPA: hypothetical protein VLL76_04450 [Candidatus Omnitrophota bacterium]|nr:hypothetical protein [Candidatus Omnitrophota bacterium]